MLKYILLATSMCIAAPAFAQETTPPDTQMEDQKPVTEAAPAAPEAPPAAEPAAPVAPANPAPVAEAVVPAATAAPVAAAPATPPTPATSQDQVAQVVTTEFGAYDKAPMDSRVMWTASVARSAEKHGFAFAYWQFSSDFLLYDFSMQLFVAPILGALVPESGALK